MNEEQERIRGYLQAQAAKMTVPELIAKVRGDSAQLKAACEAAESVDTLKRPADGEWSVNEVLAHIVDGSARVSRGILQAQASGEQPDPLGDAIEATGDVRRPSDWWSAFEEDREATFTALSTATGKEHLEVKWLHPFFGDLNWREWLLFQRIHDLDHARQVTGIVEALK
jgi:DinB superfamily